VWKHTFCKKITEALIVASKKIGLEVNAEKTKHMVMSEDRNARQNRTIKTGNKPFESVKHFKYLRTSLQIKIQFMKN
jgi:hypothetical protein